MFLICEIEQEKISYRAVWMHKYPVLCLVHRESSVNICPSLQVLWGEIIRKDDSDAKMLNTSKGRERKIGI